MIKNSHLLRHTVAAIAMLVALAAAVPPAMAQSADALVVDAREALRKRDKPRLLALRNATAGHALAQWVEYWELANRLNEAQQAELDAFYARWAGTYVEDRLRNDWLLELGRRRDWANFSRDFPVFRMNDDREVTCYQLLTQHLAGQDVRAAAREAWYAQRDLDDGCNLLASTLVQARQLTAAEVWREARLSIENNRPRAARAAAALINNHAALAVDELNDNLARFLRRAADDELTGNRAELATLALMRLASSDPEATAAELAQAWQRRLGPERAALVWATAGKQAALKLMPEAADYYQRGLRLLGPQAPSWSDETLAWAVRAALRANISDAARWEMVQRAINAMSAAEQRDSAWLYWGARALRARASAGAAGDADRQSAKQQLEALSVQMNFYGKLATEELGGRVALPTPAAPISDPERTAARANPGLARALLLIAIGLRNEGVREWNWSLRGMGDRELLAAAQQACEREVWDRCINTSDRTRSEINMAQRFPTPFRNEVLAKAREAGVDPAYVYGLIRQESRFIMDTRSNVGASGLMQLMPATARWTAKRVGLAWRPEMIVDRDINLLLGTTYLKVVLDDFGGSQALAAAAYNAGPSRPRRWREGGVLEPAAWAETIPFNETRDYVKKVLSNAVYYAAVLAPQSALPSATALSLKARLGGPIGPRDARAPQVDRDIP